MSRSHSLNRFLLVIAVLFGLASVGSYSVLADSSESTGAAVSFTHPTLNPSNPRLPLADTSGENTNYGKPSKAVQTVAVDTTPEKTKVTDTHVARTKLPDTDAETRTKLPQTGSAAVPVVFVLVSIGLGLGLAMQALRNGREIA